MREGIFIPPTVVRVLVAVLGLAFVAAIVVNAPEMVRYAKSETM